MVSLGSKFKLDLKKLPRKFKHPYVTAQKSLSLSGLLRSQYCTSNILTTLRFQSPAAKNLYESGVSPTTTSPTTTTTTEAQCSNIWKLNKCKKRKKQGKCNKANVGRNCKKTCGFCGCTDILTAKQCKKMKKKNKCGQANAAELCKETCGLCQNSNFKMRRSVV